MRKYRGKLKKQNAFKERDIMAKSGLARVWYPKIVQGGVSKVFFSIKKSKKIDSTCFWAIFGSKMSIFELI